MKFWCTFENLFYPEFIRFLINEFPILNFYIARRVIHHSILSFSLSHETETSVIFSFSLLTEV